MVFFQKAGSLQYKKHTETTAQTDNRVAPRACEQECSKMVTLQTMIFFMRIHRKNNTRFESVWWRWCEDAVVA
jgi:hypothetical protein